MSSQPTRIHLTGSSRNPAEDMPYLLCIIKTVHEYGASVTLNWVETAFNKSQRDQDNARWDWNEIVDNNLDAIRRSSAMIIEHTTHGFFQGFQAALALEQRLPVLVVSRNSVSNTPLSGISHKLLTVKQYRNEAELQDIVHKFVQAVSKPSKQLELDEQTKRFLRGESLMTGKTESDVINSLVADRLQP